MNIAHSLLVVTKTKIDSLKLQQLVTYNFMRSTMDELSTSSSFPNEATESWESAINTQRVILKNFSDKKDFRQTINTLYTQYEQPTLLFLGNLSDYSVQLQEGMLRLLEEPPTNTLPVLFVDELSSVLPTIKSRVTIHQLTNQLIFSLLNKSLQESVSKKFPSPAEACKDIIAGKSIIIKDINKCERDEIDLWLWQISMYLDQYFTQTLNSTIAQSIEKVILAKSYNEQNLQKKLVFESLSC